MLNGANLAALAAEDGRWELLQFREAKLVGQGEYLLSGFLRGLGGTEPLIGDPAPEGAVLVLLGGPLASFDPGPRGLERHYRLGPTLRSLNDESYAHGVWTWEGAGLRPLAPVHLRAERRASGDLALSWTRRARRDLDVWPGGETPLGEASERYLLRLLDAAGDELRRVERATPDFLYTAAMQAADGAAAAFAVAQISESYGPGFEGKATIGG